MELERRREGKGDGWTGEVWILFLYRHVTLSAAVYNPGEHRVRSPCPATSLRHEWLSIGPRCPESRWWGRVTQCCITNTSLAALCCMSELLKTRGEYSVSSGSSIQAGLLPTNLQQSSVYMITDCLHASRHRRIRRSGLKSLEFCVFYISLDPLWKSTSEKQLRKCRLEFLCCCNVFLCIQVVYQFCCIFYWLLQFSCHVMLRYRRVSKLIRNVWPFSANTCSLNCVLRFPDG